MGRVTGVQDIRAILPASQHYQALYPSPQETGNNLIPVTSFTSALGGDDQGTIQVNKVAIACLMAAAGQNQKLIDDHLVRVVIESEFEE